MKIKIKIFTYNTTAFRTFITSKNKAEIYCVLFLILFYIHKVRSTLKKDRYMLKVDPSA